MTDRDEDEAQLAHHATALADAIEAAVAPWVMRTVASVLEQVGRPLADDVRHQAAEAGEQARSDVGSAVRRLLAEDIDDQRTTPLSLLRGAVRYPTEVLKGAGVPPRARDEFAERAFPEDVYDLVPASFADVDPGLQEPGLVWGAAKAHVHLRRRRREGAR